LDDWLWAERGGGLRFAFGADVGEAALRGERAVAAHAAAGDAFRLNGSLNGAGGIGVVSEARGVARPFLYGADVDADERRDAAAEDYYEGPPAGLRGAAPQALHLAIAAGANHTCRAGPCNSPFATQKHDLALATLTLLFNFFLVKHLMGGPW
jgi:hypothetical protein